MAAQTFNMALEALTKKKVEDKINGLGKTIALGNLPDHASYKWHCGQVKGLADALLLMQEAAKELQAA